MHAQKKRFPQNQNSREEGAARRHESAAGRQGTPEGPEETSEVTARIKEPLIAAHPTPSRPPPRRHHSICRLHTGLAAACLLAFAPAVARPATALAYQPIPGISPRPLPSRTIERGPLEKLLDEAIQAQLDGSYIPGAVVAVVQVPAHARKPLIFSKGYGLADREAGTPVDPERTLFRLGSISKLFTWTAVTQLVEQGRLDLSADINAYLGAGVVPARFPEPVTLKHLLTHTAGFEANNYGYAVAPQGCDEATLAETVRRHLPARIRPPVTDFTRGDGALYTNSAAVLAGHIVALRSAMPYETYVERHIFQPLDMQRSTLREPLPAALAPDIALGYWITAEGEDVVYRQLGFERYCAIAPAASASATAHDMARFMLAHLQGGEIEGRRILREDTVRLMHRRALSPHPHLNGATYGFMEKYVNGRRTLWHQGTTLQFYAEVYLVPEERLGIFVAYNSPPPPEYVGQLLRRIADAYFPAALPVAVPDPEAAAAARRYAGRYGPAVRSETTWEKRALLGEALEVYPLAGGLGLRPASDAAAADEATEWIALADAAGSFRKRDGEERMAFRTGSDGRMYLLGEDAFAPYVRLSLVETDAFDRAFTRACAWAFVISIALALLSFGLARGAPYRLPQAIWAAIGAVDLAILHGVDWTLRWDTYALLAALPWPLLLATSLSLVSALLTLLALALLASAWRRPDWSAGGRLLQALQAIPAVAFLGWLWFWNLLGFHFA